MTMKAMENYTNHSPESPVDEDSPATIEKLSGWVMGLQTELRAQRASNEKKQASEEKPKKEIDFEKRLEIRDDPSVVQQGSMVAVGEVLADKVAANDHVLGAAGIKRAVRQKKLAKEEFSASSQSVGIPTGSSLQQAMWTGLIVGLSIAVLILLWLTLK